MPSTSRNWHIGDIVYVNEVLDGERCSNDDDGWPVQIAEVRATHYRGRFVNRETGEVNSRLTMLFDDSGVVRHASDIQRARPLYGIGDKVTLRESVILESDYDDVIGGVGVGRLKDSVADYPDHAYVVTDIRIRTTVSYDDYDNGYMYMVDESLAISHHMIRRRVSRQSRLLWRYTTGSYVRVSPNPFHPDEEELGGHWVRVERTPVPGEGAYYVRRDSIEEGRSYSLFWYQIDHKATLHFYRCNRDRCSILAFLGRAGTDYEREVVYDRGSFISVATSTRPGDNGPRTRFPRENLFGLPEFVQRDEDVTDFGPEDICIRLEIGGFGPSAICNQMYIDVDGADRDDADDAGDSDDDGDVDDRTEVSDHNGESETYEGLTTPFAYTCRDERITADEVRKYVHYFKSVLRIGVELEKEQTGDGSRSALRSRLNPTGNYSMLGDYGVHSVQNDGSLRHGQEVLVIGMNEEFLAWHRRMKSIHEILFDEGFHERSSAGMHYHLLTVQKDDLPAVILKNFYQLLRYYADALIWMTSCQRGIGRTRGLGQWSSWRKVMRRTPTTRSVRSLKEALGNRYVAVNLIGRGCDRGYYAQQRGESTHMRFPDGDDDILRGFHVELRWPDASDSPAHVCAIGMLFRALLLKAVEISEWGVVNVSWNRLEWENIKRRVDLFSEGINVNTADVELMRRKSMQMIRTVRNQLLSFDGASIEVLTKVAHKPPSFLRSEDGKSWTEIEEHYAPENHVFTARLDETRRAVVRHLVTGCKRKKDWEEQMAEELGVGSRETVRDRLKELKRRGHELHWDKEVGAYLWLY